MNPYSEVESLGNIAARFEVLAANETLSLSCRDRNRQMAELYRKAQEDELIRLANQASEVA